MDEDKIFDVRKVKVKTYDKTQKIEVEKTSAVKLHTRFFDWHTVSYILYAFAVILAFIAAIFVTRYLVVKKQADANTPAAVEKKITDTTDTTTITPAETKKADENPFIDTTSTDIDKTAIKIRVLNGNGINGDGAKAKSQLSDAGFTVTEVGNAKRQDYTTTQIYYLADKKEQAALIEDALKAAGRTTAAEEASADLVGKDTDVLVVTGKK